MEIPRVADGSTGSVVAGLLYEAAMTGSVDTLERLLKRHGEVVLCRFSLASFAETPLHLAALKGHLEFSRRLLELNPELAAEQDTEKCTPLHLAAANGHDQVVRELLRANEKACLVQDQEGRVPLHLAAMRGRFQVVRELLTSDLGKESMKKKADDGDGVVHLCVKYNHLDVFKVVLGSTAGGDDGEVLKMTDSRGNTVLHLAVMLKHVELVRFLLELPTVKTGLINTRNGMGFTAVDVLNHSPKDYKGLEIREILIAAAGAETVRPSRPTISADKWTDEDGAIEAPAKAQDQQQVVEESSTLRKLSWHLVKDLVKRLIDDYSGDWMTETRGSLMMVSTIIATVTFAAAIAPPGGVWQQDTTSTVYNYPCGDTICYPCTNDSICVAGNAMLAYYYPVDYLRFVKYDMISFISSLVVVFLLISGFPLGNKFSLWLLSLFMCLTVSFLGLTFLEAVWLIMPLELSKRYFKFKRVSRSVWIATMSITGAFLVIRLLLWLLRLCKGSLFKAAWRRLLFHRSSMLKQLSDNHRAHQNARRVNISSC